jgi:hypothetical protein
MMAGRFMLAMVAILGIIVCMGAFAYPVNVAQVEPQVIWSGNVTLTLDPINIPVGNTTMNVNGTSVLAALWRASQIGEFNITVENTSWGLYVSSIAEIFPENWSCGWTYEVNGQMPVVGVALYFLQTNDSVVFQYGCYNTTTWALERLLYIIKINVSVATGDLDSNGKVDFNDLIATLNLILTGKYRAVADMNADGCIDFNDLIAVLNRILTS